MTRLPAGWLAAQAALGRAAPRLLRDGLAPEVVDRLQRGAIPVGIDGLVLVPDPVVHEVVEHLLDAARSDAPLVQVAAWWSDQGHRVLELAMAASDTLGEALQRACRYEAFWSTSIDLVLEQTASTCAVQCTTLAPPSRGRNAVVAVLFVILVRAVEQALDRTLDLAEVRLRWRPIVDVSEMGRLLRVPVTFGADEDSLQLARHQLPTRLPRGYRPFADFFDDHLERIVDALPVATDVRQRVQRLLAERLVDGEDRTLARVARELGCGARTLQRRLADEGTSFTALLEQTRLELASALLRSDERTVGEIAFALGFATPAAFGRAFKRWTGEAPGTFRLASRSDGST